LKGGSNEQGWGNRANSLTKKGQLLLKLSEKKRYDESAEEKID